MSGSIEGRAKRVKEKSLDNPLPGPPLGPVVKWGLFFEGSDSEINGCNDLPTNLLTFKRHYWHNCDGVTGGRNQQANTLVPLPNAMDGITGHAVCSDKPFLGLFPNITNLLQYSLVKIVITDNKSMFQTTSIVSNIFELHQSFTLMLSNAISWTRNQM